MGTLFDHFTDGAFFATVSASKMVIVALRSVEFSMTETTEFSRFGIVSRTTSLFGCHEVRTVLTFTRMTPFPLARMMSEVVVVVSLIAVVAKVRSGHEPLEGIASVVMIVGFDEADDLGTEGCTIENDLIRGRAGDDFDAVLR